MGARTGTRPTGRPHARPGLRRWTRPAARLVLPLAALLAACTSRPRSAASFETPWPKSEAPAFHDTMELLRAVRNGSFDSARPLPPALALPPQTIHFVHGARVPDGERPKLEKVAAALAARDGLRVDVVGCSDPSGSAASKRRISTARAESVASALRELGVSDAQIGEVAGRGDDCQRKERAVHVTAALREPGGERD